jgi:hypothetical protein
MMLDDDEDDTASRSILDAVVTYDTPRMMVCIKARAPLLHPFLAPLFIRLLGLPSALDRRPYRCWMLL